MNIVIPYLYIGGIHDLRPGHWTILKLYEDRPDYPNPSKFGLKYFDQAVVDGNGFTVEHLKVCEEIVRTHVETGKSIAVCCAAGRSRSATVIISYLMSTGKSFMEAYQLVKRARPQIDPNLYLLITLFQRFDKPTVLSQVVTL